MNGLELSHRQSLLKMTRQELADRMGLSINQYHHIIAKDRPVPEEALQRIEDLLILSEQLNRQQQQLDNQAETYPTTYHIPLPTSTIEDLIHSTTISTHVLKHSSIAALLPSPPTNDNLMALIHQLLILNPKITLQLWHPENDTSGLVPLLTILINHTNGFARAKLIGELALAALPEPPQWITEAKAFRETYPQWITLAAGPMPDFLDENHSTIPFRTNVEYQTERQRVAELLQIPTGEIHHTKSLIPGYSDLSPQRWNWFTPAQETLLNYLLHSTLQQPDQTPDFHAYPLAYRIAYAIIKTEDHHTLTQLFSLLEQASYPHFIPPAFTPARRLLIIEDTSRFAYHHITDIPFLQQSPQSIPTTEYFPPKLPSDLDILIISHTFSTTLLGANPTHLPQAVLFQPHLTHTAIQQSLLNQVTSTIYDDILINLSKETLKPPYLQPLLDTQWLDSANVTILTGQPPKRITTIRHWITAASRPETPTIDDTLTKIRNEPNVPDLADLTKQLTKLRNKPTPRT